MCVWCVCVGGGGGGAEGGHNYTLSLLQDGVGWGDHNCTLSLLQDRGGGGVEGEEGELHGYTYDHGRLS